jgi:hypothetical protein
VFGSGHIANGYDQTYPDTVTESQSLRETQHHIEQWATGKEPQLGPDLPPAEEVDVCYGTVSVSCCISVRVSSRYHVLHFLIYDKSVL